MTDFELSQDELTLGDLEDVETALGMAMEDAATEPGMRLRLSSAMIWIRRRKIDPAFTFEDARALPLSMIQSVADELSDEDEADVLPNPTGPLSTVA